MGSSLDVTSLKSPCRVCSMKARRRSLCPGVSARAEVSSNASLVTRSGAWRMISWATYPPMDSPARAKVSGAAFSTVRAMSSKRSSPVRSATVISAMSARVSV